MRKELDEALKAAAGVRMSVELLQDYAFGFTSLEQMVEAQRQREARLARLRAKGLLEGIISHGPRCYVRSLPTVKGDEAPEVATRTFYRLIRRQGAGRT